MSFYRKELELSKSDNEAIPPDVAEAIVDALVKTVVKASQRSKGEYALVVNVRDDGKYSIDIANLAV